MFSHGFEGQIDCLKCGNGFMPETPKALDLNMMYESFGNVGEDEFKSVTAKVKDALVMVLIQYTHAFAVHFQIKK